MRRPSAKVTGRTDDRATPIQLLHFKTLLLQRPAGRGLCSIAVVGVLSLRVIRRPDNLRGVHLQPRGARLLQDAATPTHSIKAVTSVRWVQMNYLAYERTNRRVIGAACLPVSDSHCLANCLHL
jgi:hypothetical protein